MVLEGRARLWPILPDAGYDQSPAFHLSWRVGQSRRRAGVAAAPGVPGIPGQGPVTLRNFVRTPLQVGISAYQIAATDSVLITPSEYVDLSTILLTSQPSPAI